MAHHEFDPRPNVQDRAAPHLLPQDEWEEVQRKAAIYGPEDLNNNGIPDSEER